MTTEDLSQELMRIKGELSAACTFVGMALHLASFGDPETIKRIRGKIAESPIDPASGDIANDPHWREGVNRFNNRLLECLPDEQL